MTPVDPMAVAVDWLDAYRAGRINQIVGLYSRDAVIECACGGNKTIYSDEGIAAYWRRRFLEAVMMTYRTSSGLGEALLDITEDGLIACCSCGPVLTEGWPSGIAPDC